MAITGDSLRADKNLTGLQNEQNESRAKLGSPLAERVLQEATAQRSPRRNRSPAINWEQIRGRNLYQTQLWI